MVKTFESIKKKKDAGIRTCLQLASKFVGIISGMMKTILEEESYLTIMLKILSQLTHVQNERINNQWNFPSVKQQTLSRSLSRLCYLTLKQNNSSLNSLNILVQPSSRHLQTVIKTWWRYMAQQHMQISLVFSVNLSPARVMKNLIFWYQLLASVSQEIRRNAVSRILMYTHQTPMCSFSWWISVQHAILKQVSDSSPEKD